MSESKQKHDYFFQIPNVASDDLDLYEFRLYTYLVCEIGKNADSRKTNEIDLSQRTIYKATGMHPKTVRKAQTSLQAKGYITVRKPSISEQLSGVCATYAILESIWEENARRHSKKAQVDDQSVTQVDDQSVTQVDDQSVTQVSRSLNTLNTKEKENTSASRSDAETRACARNAAPNVASSSLRSSEQVFKSESKSTIPDPLDAAISQIWHYSGNMLTNMREMLLGTSKRKGWKEYKFEVPVTAQELLDWALWYFKTSLGGDSKLNMVENHGKIQSSITYWRSLESERMTKKATSDYYHDLDARKTAERKRELCRNKKPDNSIFQHVEAIEPDIHAYQRRMDGGHIDGLIYRDGLTLSDLRAQQNHDPVTEHEIEIDLEEERKYAEEVKNRLQEIEEEISGEIPF